MNDRERSCIPCDVTMGIGRPNVSHDESYEFIFFIANLTIGMFKQRDIERERKRERARLELI